MVKCILCSAEIFRESFLIFPGVKFPRNFPDYASAGEP